MHGLFLFSKQKTAYEMLISDWSSDVCSSDLEGADDPVLEVVHVAPDVRPAPIQVEHHVGHALAGAVIGELAAAPAAVDGEAVGLQQVARLGRRSEEHTSELQSLMRISYAVV